MGDLSGDLAYPSALLLYARIDTHEVGTGQVGWFAVGGNRPIYIKRTTADTVVGMIIGITKVVWLEEPHIAFAIFVHSVIGQTSARESERRVGKPKWEVVLRVESILIHIPLLALVVVPQNIGGVGKGVLYVGLWRGSYRPRPAGSACRRTVQPQR